MSRRAPWARPTRWPRARLPALLEQFEDGFDVAIEAVGRASTIRAAMNATRIGGLTALVGMPPTGMEVGFDAFEFTAQEKFLVGSMYGSGDPAVTAAATLREAESGALKLGPLLGPSFDLDYINDGIAVALAGEAGRTTILPNGTHRCRSALSPMRKPGNH